MNMIGDDELGLVLSRVTEPADRKSASQVCKRWWVMEGLSRSSLRVLNMDHLPRLLARGSALESLALQCPSLKSIVVNEKWRDGLLQEMQESTVSRFLQFKN
ncbi:hypothetical protein ABKV19_019518 [Rosa sericea]